MRAEAVAAVVAALFAVGPAGVASADLCGGFGPGYMGGNCGPYNNGSSQSDNSSWPPGINSGSGGGITSDTPSWPPGISFGSGGASTPATPIVPVSSGH